MIQRFARQAAALALVLGLAAPVLAQDADVPEITVRGELHGEELTLEQFQAQRLALYQSLERDGLFLSPAARHEATADLDRYARLKVDAGCKTCGPEGAKREIVGMEIEQGIVVDFSDVSSTTLSNSLSPFRGGDVRATQDGGVVWSTMFDSPGAAGLRLRLDGVNIPEGVELYLYNDYGDANGPWGGTGDVNGQLWTTELGGDRLYAELRVAPDANLADTRFVIGAVDWLDPEYFGTYPPDPRDRSGCPGLSSCIDSERCYDETDFSAIANARRGQASILFSDGGATAVCTGGLVADTNTGTTVPYFITAHHCFSTQASASSASFTWDYRKSTCTGSCPSRFSFPSNTGATLLVTLPDNSSGNDMTFLRLNSTPPGTRYYYGWTTTSFAFTNNTPFWSLHHPNGSAMMYSEHSVTTSAGTCTGLPRGRYIYLRDRVAGTEGGSSGSSLLRPDPASPTDAQIVGQLFGTCGSNNLPCDWVNNASVYGNFASYFPSIQTYLSTSVTATINQAAGQADPAFDFPIEFTIEFSEAVSGFTVTDIQVTGTGLVLSSSLSGGPTTYTYSITNALPGTFIANVPANAAESVATPGILTNAATSTDNTVTFVEASAPTVTINQAAGQPDPTNDLPISYTVQFSEDVSGFTFFDVDFSGGTPVLSGGLSGGPQTYTLTASFVDGEGNVVPTIPAGVATSTATGLGNDASTSTDNSVRYDVTAPGTGSLARGGTTPDPATPANLPLLFVLTTTEGVTPVQPSNIIVTTNIGTPQVTVQPFGAAGVIWRVFVDFDPEPTLSGPVTVGLDPAGLTDLAGNAYVHNGATASVQLNVPASTVGWMLLE